MKRLIIGCCAAALAALGCGQDEGAGATASAAVKRGGEVGTVFELERMTGVARPYVGTQNPVRGVSGGGLPWVLKKGEARLGTDGVLAVEVEGLVFDPNDAAVQARGVRNTNPVTAFRAIVSCQTIDATGAAAVVNVSTAAYPATTGALADGAGDARFSEAIALPSPCYAPIVFVTSPAGAWFAASST